MKNDLSFIVMLFVENGSDNKIQNQDFRLSLVGKGWSEIGIVTNGWTKIFSDMEQEDIEASVLSDITDAFFDSDIESLPYAFQIGVGQVGVGVI